jgi:hypothetical protein
MDWRKLADSHKPPLLLLWCALCTGAWAILIELGIGVYQLAKVMARR